MSQDQQDQQDQDARKVAEHFAADTYGDKARITHIEGPHEITGERTPHQPESVTYAWVADVAVPGRGTAKVTVMRDPQGWYAVEVERPQHTS